MTKDKTNLTAVSRDAFIAMYRRARPSDSAMAEEDMWQRFIQDAHKFDMVAVVDEPAEWGEAGL